VNQHAPVAVSVPLQALPSNGKRYHEIRQGKLFMLPACSTHFNKLLHVSRTDDTR
jgi:hypothetical protein